MLGLTQSRMRGESWQASMLSEVMRCGAGSDGGVGEAAWITGGVGWERRPLRIAVAMFPAAPMMAIGDGGAEAEVAEAWNFILLRVW